MIQVGKKCARVVLGTKTHRMIAVQVRGSFFCTQAVVPAMKQRRYGKIINISSIWGMTGAPVASHYCAAKAALLGLTKAWAKELAPWNIHVNAVAPGGVRSGGPLKLDNPEILRAKEEKVPLKRYCEPIEIAYAVAYLASPDADLETGQVLSPNGGETIVGMTTPFVLGLGGTPRNGSATERALRVSLAAAEAQGADREIIAGEDLVLPIYDSGNSDRSAKHPVHVSTTVSKLRSSNGMASAEPSIS